MHFVVTFSVLTVPFIHNLKICSSFLSYLVSFDKPGQRVVNFVSLHLTHTLTGVTYFVWFLVVEQMMDAVFSQPPYGISYIGSVSWLADVTALCYSTVCVGGGTDINVQRKCWQRAVNVLQIVCCQHLPKTLEFHNRSWRSPSPRDIRKLYKQCNEMEILVSK